VEQGRGLRSVFESLPPLKASTPRSRTSRLQHAVFATLITFDTPYSFIAENSISSQPASTFHRNLRRTQFLAAGQNALLVEAVQTDSSESVGTKLIWRITDIYTQGCFRVYN
jgi:hypothetical protein